MFVGLLAITATTAAAASTGSSTRVWYVSPTGSDANAGDAPSSAFQTVGKTQSMVRAYNQQHRDRADGKQEVRMLPGTYYTNETIVFDRDDGGDSPGTSTLWTGWEDHPAPLHTSATVASAASAASTPTSPFPKNTATLSFGIEVEGRTGWTQDSEKPQLWHKTIAEVQAGSVYPRQLWDQVRALYEQSRVLRCTAVH